MANSDEPMSRALFAQLMAQFFDRGWMVGSSGGMAVLMDDEGLVMVSPSSVSKERLRDSDIFLMRILAEDDQQNQVICGPSEQLRPSACWPLFQLLIRSTPGCHCVIHTHSKYANLVSALHRTRDRLEISGEEMLKGVVNRRTGKAMRNTDTLMLPMVENVPEEQDLLAPMETVLVDPTFADSSAILVKHHGLFVWGPSWQKTKVMLECLEYLLEIRWEWDTKTDQTGKK